MEVKLIDSMGNDYSPIRAAIVSNGANDSSKYVDDDLNFTPAAVSLINFLARGCTQGEWDHMGYNLRGLLGGEDEPFEDELNEVEDILNHIRHMPPHWTPFGHTAITVHVKAPIFVARQLGKHQTGFVWNEISRRYVDTPPEFYMPEKWRKRAENKKQGSSEEEMTHITWETEVGDYYSEGMDLIEVGGKASTIVQDHYNASLSLYEAMLNCQCSPEQARMVLPQSMYTEWYWTGNLYAFANMFVARTDSHTQQETREVAHMIGDLIEPLFPISWKALTT